MYRKFLAIILILVGVAYASNFGSTVKLNPVVIKNQSSEFNLLLWTTDETSQTVILQLVQKPENWTVNIEKPEILISRDTGNEMVYAQDYIHATSVKVSVDQQGSKPGSYNIIVSAKIIPASGEMLFSQERLFNLIAVIEGKTNTINIDIPDTSPQNTQSNYNFPVTFLVIIFISFVIYKYS